jgi:hypothetical protein
MQIPQYILNLLQQALNQGDTLVLLQYGLGAVAGVALAVWVVAEATTRR